MGFSESTNINIFGTEFIDISFIEKDYTGPHVGYDQSEKRIKIIRPDAIQFSHNQALFVRLRDIQGIALQRISSISSECAQTIYHLPASQSEYFFNTVTSLQKNDPTLFVSKKGLETTLSSLIQKKHLSQDQADQFDIKTFSISQNDREKAVLKSYCNKVLEELKGCLQSDLFCPETLSWIIRAKECLGSNRLQERAQIAPFFEKLCVIDIIEFFNPFCDDELVKAALTSRHLRQICLPESSYYTKERTKNIAAFLKKCPRISLLCLEGSSKIPPNGRLSIEMLSPIANALQENSSITSLTLSYANLGDDGAQLLLDTLITNQKLKLTSLVLTDCNISDSSVPKIKELLQNKPTLTFLNLSGNDLKESSKKELEEALRKNKPI